MNTTTTTTTNNNNNDNNNNNNNKYLDLARELKKTMEHESDDCTNCDWWFWHGN